MNKHDWNIISDIILYMNIIFNTFYKCFPTASIKLNYKNRNPCINEKLNNDIKLRDNFFDLLLLSTHSHDSGGESNLPAFKPPSSFYVHLASSAITLCFPTSFNIKRSSKEPGCASWEHCNMYGVVSSAFPQTYVVSPV